MTARSSLSSSVLSGTLHGAAAWSAYAIGEFLYSSGIFRLVRPYATFTGWHWQLTAELLSAYLVCGLIAGALAGLVVHLLGRNASQDPAEVEYAATLTLIAAFLYNVITDPTYAPGTMPVRVVAVLLAATVLAAILSPVWRERAGLLPNIWIIAALLLGACQHVSLLQMNGVAAQLGLNMASLYGVLWFLVVVLALAAGYFGRRVTLSRGRFSLAWPSRAAIAILLVLTIFSAVSGRGTAPPPTPKPVAAAVAGAKPNLVVIVMDTVRADHLSVYGYNRDTTPNLKKLAADASVYPNALAASDITLTSHASLFTGVYPSWHGAYCQPPEATYGGAVSKNVLTLAEALHAKGYRTLGVAANLYLRADFGLQRGFDVFHIPRPVPVLAAENSHLLRQGVRRWMSRFFDTAQFDRLFSRGEEVNHELFHTFQSSGAASSPFFVFLNYMDAHFPYVPPAPYNEQFRTRNLRILQDQLARVHIEVSRGNPMPEAAKTYSIDQYDGGIAYIDAHIGEVMNWLKAQNLYENTMIVVTSDHGEAFGERGLVEHGNSPYQNLLNVALLVKYPKNEPKGEVPRAVSLIDVFPTALAALGLPAIPTLQGRSLLDSSEPARPIFSETFPCPVLHNPECPDGCTSRAMVSWPNKYISSSNGKLEMFDLSTDRDELQNRLRQDALLARELGLQLTQWVKTRPVQQKQQIKLDAEALERLKSLGYVQGNSK